MTCPDCDGSGRQIHWFTNAHEFPSGHSWTFKDVTETSCECSPYVGLPPEDHAARLAADPDYVPF